MRRSASGRGRGEGNGGLPGRGSLAAIWVALLAGLLAGAPAPAAPPASGTTATVDTTEIHVTDVRIPVPDGVSLHARLWRPQPRDRARPTILSMTPYTADDAHDYGVFFARAGYNYLNVDVRGRGDSGGTFWPLVQDGPDGAAVVRWIAGRSWSDGRVAARGGSYRGMVQWQILAQGPLEALRTVVPTASAYPGWDFPNSKGIFSSYAARWLAFVQGRASQGALFGDSDYWNARYMEMHRQGRPFAELDEVTGVSSRVFERWIEHPHMDDYWRAPSPDPDDYARLDLPILTVTGHFDGDQPGALRYVREHMEHGSPSGRAQHHVLIGPWSHGGTRAPESELGGLTFADTAALDMDRLHREWFDWVLRDGEKPALLEDRVVYYVMGADRWRSAPSLDAVADTTRRLYLSSPSGPADGPFSPGELAPEPPERPDADRYVYDPRDTADVATLRQMEEGMTGPGAAWLDGPKLVYQSRPLEESVEVSGRMRLDAWIEMDVPDTDLAARVYEVRPTGRTIRLGETELRARHRLGVDTTALVEPGAVHRYRFDRFFWFSRRLEEGSRIRLVVAPLNTPAVQKNYNSGGDPMEESVEDARTATVRLHMSPDRPSALVLPVRSDGR